MARTERDPANPGVAVDGGSSGEDEVAAKLAAEQDAGGRGDFTDPTPNENYTVAGVTAGLPTPETDEALAREARDATRLGGTKFEHGEAETAAATDAAPADDGKLTGDALQARGAELEIEGRSSMSADELRDAIAAKESEQDSGNGS